MVPLGKLLKTCLAGNVRCVDNWNREVKSNFGLNDDYVGEVENSVAKVAGADLCYEELLERL